MRLHAVQRVGVLVGFLKTRNRAEADRLAEPPGRRLRVHRCARHRRHLKLARAMAEDIERQHAGEDQDGGDQEQQDVADDSD